MTYRTPEQVTHAAPVARRYRGTQGEDLAIHYGGQAETFPPEITIGSRVTGRLGTDAEVGSWGPGTIEEISENRREASVRFGNKQIRLMSANECFFEDAP